MTHKLVRDAGERALGYYTGKDVTDLSHKLVAADALGFKTYNPRHVPAIPLQVFIDHEEVWVISEMGHSPVQGNLWVKQ